MPRSANDQSPPRFSRSPRAFNSQRIPTNGTTLYTRIGGTGPAVVLLHGYGETVDMWSLLPAKLAANHTVIVPDLRGTPWRARRTA